jgi:hypothetical protein
MLCHLVLRIFLALHQLSAPKDNLRLNVADVLSELIDSGAATLNLLPEQVRLHPLPGAAIADFARVSEDLIELTQGFSMAMPAQFHNVDNTFHPPYILLGSLDTT